MNKKFLCFTMITALLLSFLGVKAKAAETEDVKSSIQTILQGVKSAEDLISAGYSEPKEVTEEEVEVGDVIFKDNNFYVCMSISYGITKWGLVIFSGDTVDLVESNFSFKKGTEVYKYAKQDAVFSIPTGLVGYFGSPLYSVTLPDGFSWVNPQIILSSEGVSTYKALYTPTNPVIYKSTEVDVEVTVEKSNKEVIYPCDRYTVSYSDGLTLDTIALPEGWSFTAENRSLDVGEGIFTTVYASGTAEEIVKEVTIIVIKGKFNIEDFTLEVKKGSKLENSLFPSYDIGKFTWVDKDVVVNEDGDYKCNFIPADKEHFETTEGVTVHVKVYEEEEKKKEEPTQAPDTTPTQAPTTSDTTPTTPLPAPVTTPTPTIVPTPKPTKEPKEKEVIKLPNITSSDIKLNKENKEYNSNTAQALNVVVTKHPSEVEETPENIKPTDIKHKDEKIKDDNEEIDEDVIEEEEKIKDDEDIAEVSTEDVDMHPVTKEKDKIKKVSKTPYIVVGGISGLALLSVFFFVLKKKKKKEKTE